MGWVRHMWTVVRYPQGGDEQKEPEERLAVTGADTIRLYRENVLALLRDMVRTLDNRSKSPRIKVGKEYKTVYGALIEAFKIIEEKAPYKADFVAVPVAPPRCTEGHPVGVPFMRAFATACSVYSDKSLLRMLEPLLLMNDFMRMATLHDICRVIGTVIPDALEKVRDELGILCVRDDNDDKSRFTAPFPKLGVEYKHYTSPGRELRTSVYDSERAIMVGPVTLGKMKSSLDKQMIGVPIIGTVFGAFLAFPVKLPPRFDHLPMLGTMRRIFIPDATVITYRAVKVGYVRAVADIPRRDEYVPFFIPFIWAPAEWRA